MTNLDLGLKCLKHMLIVSNFMFMVIGILIILMGDSIISIYDDFSIFIELHYFSPAVFVIAIGVIILLVSLMGCVGAILYSTMIVNIYTLLMCFLLILEVAAAITAFVRRQDIEDFVNTSMYESMNFYKNDTGIADSWNYIQKQFSCCGVHYVWDWFKHDINETSITIANKTFGVPSSCCVSPNCTVVLTGCLDYIFSIVSEGTVLLGTAAVCVAIVQLLGSIFGSLLAKTIRQVKSRDEMIRQQQNTLYNQITNGKSSLYE